eukprot:CAMPEP_0202758240 /NCGR_PEP_ID=MMETSP1388-20130828/16930_1 /ASSEMBLY_ACC=CAM_ASM_000864 /TAXON_ID=37098 /ORGANISM="Isochrysis sp, Strain CCMP1244" /LENGTH=60 /DNA_ID=CAMNT_0049426175 /DNA_START=84 /DNA_END=262 /DNA_ORIENTATION=-
MTRGAPSVSRRKVAITSVSVERGSTARGTDVDEQTASDRKPSSGPGADRQRSQSQCDCET